MSTPICKVWDVEQGKYVGIPAIKGTDGHTPVKGTDYWTASDKQEIVNDVLKDIPSALPNPNAITFTGAVTGSYDGSGAMTVNIPSAVTDAHINSLIDTKLGVIENGSY